MSGTTRPVTEIVSALVVLHLFPTIYNPHGQNPNNAGYRKVSGGVIAVAEHPGPRQVEHSAFGSQRRAEVYVILNLRSGAMHGRTLEIDVIGLT
jgi:hypothetical protein